MMKRAIWAFIVMCLTAMCLQATESLTFRSGESAATLVELFTSQGCSSCPPAEKWFSSFKADPNLWKNIVPIAFHVDYWDHLGWVDRFASVKFTERQRRYADLWKTESVYTPGFAVAGKEWRGYFSGSSIPAANARVGILQIAFAPDNALSATFTPNQSSTHGFVFEAALLGCDRETDVAFGENKGKKLHHDFVVLQLANGSMTSRDGRWTGELKFPPMTQPTKANAVAAWVLPADGYEPVQATGGWIRPKS